MNDLLIFILPGLGVFSVIIFIILIYILRKRRNKNRRGNLIITPPKTKIGIEISHNQSPIETMTSSAPKPPNRISRLGGTICNVHRLAKSAPNSVSPRLKLPKNDQSAKPDRTLSVLSMNPTTFNGNISNNAGCALQRYRRFYDEPLIIVDTNDTVDADKKTMSDPIQDAKSFSNPCYQNSTTPIQPDDTLSNYSVSSDGTNISFPRDLLFFPHNNYNINGGNNFCYGNGTTGGGTVHPYVSDPYFSLQLDREQSILARNRRNVKILDDDQISDSYKLRREMAEAIAEDKAQENTVTFTTSAYPPEDYDDFSSTLTNTDENFAVNYCDKRKLVVSRDFDVIARERTAV